MDLLRNRKLRNLESVALSSHPTEAITTPDSPRPRPITKLSKNKERTTFHPGKSHSVTWRHWRFTSPMLSGNAINLCRILSHWESAINGQIPPQGHEFGTNLGAKKIHLIPEGWQSSLCGLLMYQLPRPTTAKEAIWTAIIGPQGNSVESPAQGKAGMAEWQTRRT